MIKRHLSPDIIDSLKHFPVVLITGARQVGKSTLAQELARSEWGAQYLTLDNRIVLDAVLEDPDGFIKGTPVPAIIDEIQRAPDLMRAIKLAVDRNRKPGQYLLTGSANLMTLSKVSETLAGRIALHELQPFSWSEISNKKPPDLLKDIFEEDDAGMLLKKWERQSFPDRREEIKDRIIAGGYPTPSMMSAIKARRRWFDSYRQTYVERDIRDIAAIEHLPAFNRLLNLLSFRTGQVVNFSEISRELGLPFTTIRRYIDLLETTYQIFFVRPYYANIGKRLIKMPKVYLGDTGMACHLSAAEDWETLERQGRTGNMVETWAASELRKIISIGDMRYQLYYWRTYAGREVDFLLEHGERVAAIEVKWTQNLGESDLSGLKDCARDLKDRH
ncbi:MAG: ATP-binding protein, partial [Candidatus Roizmanbacteria bacterium]|nr:ATP-binding protein [Candidatus Roizmanbacteria bacterium]